MNQIYPYEIALACVMWNHKSSRKSIQIYFGKEPEESVDESDFIDLIDKIAKVITVN